MKNLTYSAISYVAAALILSGPVLANPADLSGAFNSDVNVVDVSEYSIDFDQGVYLALNRYPVTLPPLSSNSSTANKASNTVLKSEAYIDSLQRELRDELDIIIEAQELF